MVTCPAATCTLLYRKKNSVMHVGVLIGNDRVAHLSPLSTSLVTSFAEFAQGEQVHFANTNVLISHAQENLHRLISENKKYDLLSYNCEHFASDLLYNEPSSPQLQIVVSTGLIGASTCLLISDNKLLSCVGWLGAVTTIAYMVNQSITTPSTLRLS